MNGSAYEQALGTEKEIENQLAEMQASLEKQRAATRKLKWAYKHPYMNAIVRWCAMPPAIAGVTVEYLPDHFCEQCERLHMDDRCVNCTWHRDRPCTAYITQGEMKYLHQHTLPDNRGHLFCFQPLHMDDIALVRQWNTFRLTCCGGSAPQSWEEYSAYGKTNDYPVDPHSESMVMPILSSIHKTVCCPWRGHGHQCESQPHDIPKGHSLVMTATGSDHRGSLFSVHSF